jgi:hypothetical protein
MSDTQLLITATRKMYVRSLSGAAQALLRSWWLPVAHALAAIILAIPLRLFGMLGFIGSLFAGLLLAFAVAGYLASLHAVMRKESLKSVPTFAMALFSPVINVLFVFFLLELLLGTLLKGPEFAWIQASFWLLVGIFGNALPEIIYLQNSTARGVFNDSLEFTLENWIEWFLPLFLIVVSCMLYFSQLNLVVVLTLLKIHPIRLLEYIIVFMGQVLYAPQLILYCILFSFILYYCALFRGFLFQELAMSTRRKRIYAERTGQ